MCKQDKSSQTIKAEGGSVIRNVIQAQTLNIHIDADIERLKRELTTAKEHHWQEQYERMRTDVNGGYHEIVQEPINQLLAEIEDYEDSESPVNVELKARIYRLAATVYLPRHSGGDAQRCTALLARARQVSSSEDNLSQCQIIQALLDYESGNVEVALELLDLVKIDEASRLRFGIYLETNQLDECRHLIEVGQVDPGWSQNNPSWSRVFLGYYTAIGSRVEAESNLNLLIDQEPSASNYQAAAHSLVRLAYARMHSFCLAHDMFPEFHIALELDELVDLEIQSRAAYFFAEAAARYEQKGCILEAAQMLKSAILISLDDKSEPENLIHWTTRLRQLDPHNSLLIMLKSADGISVEVTENPPSLLDLQPLLADPATEPLYIFRVAIAVSDTPIRAAEVALILERQFERFKAKDVTFANYAFVVLQLWQISGNIDQALAWLERSKVNFSHPRLASLYYAWFYWHLGDFSTARDWVEQALKIAPEHPEVLAVAFLIYYQLDQPGPQLVHTQALFEILRTRQTATWYMIALSHNRDYRSILKLLDSSADLYLDESFVRSWRVQALIGLNRGLEAREDLEWLRLNNFASAADLLNLAGAYHLLSDLDAAIAVLHDCIQRFPTEVESYLQLSYTYLMTGRRDESFEWALKARQQFPSNPDVLFHLFSVSFPTGRELHPEVRAAFGAFMPGGPFAGQSPFIQLSLDELFDLIRPRQESLPTSGDLYLAGRISYMMLSQVRNIPMFLAHLEDNEVSATRYIANGDQLRDLALLAEDKPREVVLDYSALLTLWSLLDRDILSFLINYFDRLWLPDQLRLILLHEHDRIVQFVQTALNEARCTVRDTLNMWPDKFVLHPRVDPPDGWDILGRHTEMIVAQRNGLFLLDEHTPPDESPSDVPSIGIASLAEMLYQAGEIDPITLEALEVHAKASAPEEVALSADLKQKREMVVSLATLVTWAMHTGLQPILNYFEQLHVAQPARERLLAEIAGFEFRQRALSSIQGLRRVLRQGEENGFIIFGTISEEERLIKQHMEERRKTELEDTLGELDPAQQRLFNYLDELIGLAHRESIPIWTDDRWIKYLQLQPRQLRYCFGTDTFLAFAQQYPSETGGALSQLQYHTYYDKLTGWAYRILPINVDHILWHLAQGRDVNSRVLANLLEYYRQNITGLLNWLNKTKIKVDEQFASQIVGYYNEHLITALHELYERNISTTIAAKVFSALDLSRHATNRVLGREPLIFTLFLLDVILRQSATRKEDRLESSLLTQQALPYSHWLNGVLLESGVELELLEEAWYQLAQYFFVLLDNAETEANQLGAMVLIERMLDALPVPVMKYLLSTNIGIRLQNDFKLEILQQVFYRIVTQSGEKIEHHLSSEELERDYGRAVNHYLEDPSEGTVSAGDITLKIQPVAPGSMFLVVEEIPTEIYTQHPDAKGLIKYACLLYGFTSLNISHRKAVWKFGLQALEYHQAPVATWTSLHEELLRPDEIGIQAGLRLRRHLLSHGSITKEYFIQAAQLAPTSIIQLLTFIEPSDIREWLAMPSLDWSSAEALIQWTNESLAESSEKQRQLDVVSLLALYGRSIFPDASIVRQHILSAFHSLSSASDQVDLVEKLLSFAETQSSLALKANTALIVYEWLHRDTAPQNSGGAGQGVTDKLNSLLVQILQGWAIDDPWRAAIATLEAVICRWLYSTWSTPDLGEDENIRGLAYLAYVGASHIIDALATDGQISLEMTRSIINVLNSNIRTGAIVSGIEPQPDSFFRPVWCLSLNYAASYLLKALVSDNLPPPEFGSDPKIKSAALLCGFEHRREQVFSSPILPKPSWFDAELAIDIGLASVAILEPLSEAEIESWSEQDRNLYLFASASEAILELPKTIIVTLPDLDDEQQFMQHIQSLFQGQFQPTPKWYELLQDFLSEKVLNKLRQFAECYGEVMWRLGQMVLHSGQNCPAELTASIETLLFEVPISENAPDLLKVKADVLSQLVGLGLTVEPVCQWLRKVAEEKSEDVPMVRLALRPFILRWPHYPEKVGELLYEALIEIAQLPNFRNLWEFARLVRASKLQVQTAQNQTDITGEYK